MALRRPQSLDALREEDRTYRRVVWNGGGRRRPAPTRDAFLRYSQIRETVRLLGEQKETGDIAETVVPAHITSEGVSETGQEGSKAYGEALLSPPSELETQEAGPSGTAVQLTTGSPRILRIISDLDRALLLRTQMRHELESLRRSREFVESSLASLYANSGAAERKVTEETGDSPRGGFMTSASSTVPIDTRFSLQGDSADPAGLTQLHATGPQETAVDAPQSFKQLFEQFRQDLERVRRQEQEFTISLESLSNLEYHLNERQKKLVVDLKDRQRATQVIEEIYTAPQASFVREESARSPSDLPSLVETYFDRCGDVGVWIERSQELAEAYAEGLAEREFIADRGDPLEVSGEEFQKRYQEKQDYIDQELQIARAAADELEQQCRAAGYDTEAYRTMRRSETGSNPHLSELLTANSPAPNPIRELESLSLEAPRLESHVTEQQPARRIDSWLRAVPLNEFEPTEEAVPMTPSNSHPSDLHSSPASAARPTEGTEAAPLPVINEIPASAGPQQLSEDDVSRPPIISTDFCPLSAGLATGNNLHSPRSMDENSRRPSLSAPTIPATYETDPSTPELQPHEVPVRSDENNRQRSQSEPCPEADH